MNDIERGLTNSSSNERDSFIEGGNVPLYLGITVTLFIITIGSFFYLSSTDHGVSYRGGSSEISAHKLRYVEISRSDVITNMPT
ncbi:MAG: hypothetical protein WCB79_09695 [Halobacteriota archaeon]